MLNDRKNKSSKKQQGYLRQAITLAPMALIKGVIDLPEGAIEKGVEATIAKQQYKPLQILNRGVGRMVGHIPVAIMTAPLYFSGIKDLQDKETRTRGIAKIMAASGGLGLGKGIIEASIEKATGAQNVSKKFIRNLGLARLGLGIAAAIPVALGVAKGEKERKEGKKSLRAYLYPAIGGATAGFSKGLLEGAISREGGTTALKSILTGKEGLGSLTARRLLWGPAIGKAVSGAIGGAVLGGLVHHFQKNLEKHSSADDQSDSEITVPNSNIKLLPHQEGALIKFLQNNGRLLVAHGTGTGKTETSISAHLILQHLGKAQRALVVVPAALRYNYADRLKRKTNASFMIIGNEKDSTKINDLVDKTPEKDFYIVSYETLRLHPELVDIIKPQTLILDEIQRIKDSSGLTFKSLWEVRNKVPYVMGLTGSIVGNSPAEMLPLLQYVVGQPVISSTQFKQKFMKPVSTYSSPFSGQGIAYQLRNLSALRNIVQPNVDYVSIPSERYPQKIVNVIRVPMSDEQKKLYDYAMNKLNPVIRHIISKDARVPPEKLKEIFTQIIKARQASNATHTIKNETPQEALNKSPKILKVLSDAKAHLDTTPDGQIIMYSNFINGGIDILDAGLDKLKIPHGIYAGVGSVINGKEITSESRQKDVEDYLSGKKRVIIISGAGAEGLNLPNTTMVQILDPHYNPERILQAEARGIRMDGLAHRPPEQRQVIVNRYLSVLPEKLLRGKEVSVDEWIYNTAKAKAQTNSTLHTFLATTKPQQTISLNTIIQNTKTQQPSKVKSTHGVELPKNPGTKYVKRFRTPSGNIYYQYENN